MTKQKTIKRKKVKLPKKFAKYFWDCDQKQINRERYLQFVLGRIMSCGGEGAILWVLGNFSAADVKKVLSSVSGRGQLDKRSFVFWTRISKIRGLWS